MNDNRMYEFHSELKRNGHLYYSLALQFDLSECAFWILYILRSNFALLTQRDLCEYLKQPKQSVHTALKKLIEKGYIELSFGDDKRSKYITLTDVGNKFAEQTIDRVIEAERKALTGLSGDEIKHFFEIMHRYTDLLEERFELI